ncbi:MAG: tRNA dihydrouridine(20/20a) synthase DusA [Blastochloris sp.]|nr:tRNA dihydrouridine(20/20a) synthase DusA [Blastochloris sp.]
MTVAIIVLLIGTARHEIWWCRRTGRNETGIGSLGLSGNSTAGSGTEKVQNKEKDEEAKAHRFCVAPMLDWTDRHCRFFHRHLTRRALLYSEMVTTGAVIHGDRARILGFSPDEQPVAIQLGGADPKALAEAAHIAQDFGYVEINLNVGCPSDRVQEGRFGACLMREPQLVGDCVAAIKAAVKVPVTVKCRIGVDDQDPEAALDMLAEAAVAAGVDALIVHARKAWLEGLSPRQNRDVPPLDYDRVYRLKRARPTLDIILNGGIATLEEARAHLVHVDGVMLGRAAYQEPWRLLQVDPDLFGVPSPVASMAEAIEHMIPYSERHLADGGRLAAVTRHMVGAFHAVPGARRFRRMLAEGATRPAPESRSSTPRWPRCAAARRHRSVTGFVGDQFGAVINRRTRSFPLLQGKEESVPPEVMQERTG